MGSCDGDASAGGGGGGGDGDGGGDSGGAVRPRAAGGVREPDLLRDGAIGVVLLQPARAAEGGVPLPVRERPDVRVLRQQHQRTQDHRRLRHPHSQLLGSIYRRRRRFAASCRRWRRP